MTKEEIISMLSKELKSEWTNGVTCLMVENSDSYIPVIVHHNKNELIAYLMLRKFFRSILVMIIYYVGRHGKLDIGWDMILSLTWMT